MLRYPASGVPCGVLAGYQKVPRKPLSGTPQEFRKVPRNYPVPRKTIAKVRHPRLRVSPFIFEVFREVGRVLE